MKIILWCFQKQDVIRDCIQHQDSKNKMPLYCIIFYFIEKIKIRSKYENDTTKMYGYIPRRVKFLLFFLKLAQLIKRHILNIKSRVRTRDQKNRKRKCLHRMCIRPDDEDLNRVTVNSKIVISRPSLTAWHLLQWSISYDSLWHYHYLPSTLSLSCPFPGGIHHSYESVRLPKV